MGHDDDRAAFPGGGPPSGWLAAARSMATDQSVSVSLHPAIVAVVQATQREFFGKPERVEADRSDRAAGTGPGK